VLTESTLGEFVTIKPGLPMKFCPKCGNKTFRITEARAREAVVRQRVPAMRIRRRCLTCGHAETFYEIDAHQMEHFENLQRFEEGVLKYMKLDTLKGDACYECIHWDNKGCTMGLPEAGGAFAQDCSLFQKS